jgi:hypothetical protein
MAMTKQTYHIDNGTNAPLTYRVKIGSRVHASLEALRHGPLLAPSPIRRSEHIRQFREAGMLIDTEMRDQYAREGQYGVYHLRSTVTPATRGAE